MSSEADEVMAAGLDTSWINAEPAAAGASSGGSGSGSGSGGTRGRGDSKRRTRRRRTVSPSIGKHNCMMYNVDLDDPLNFPSLYSSGSRGRKGSRSRSSSRCGRANGAEESPAGEEEDVVGKPGSARPLNAATAFDTSAAAGSYSSSTSQDGDMPDPTVVAGLFDLEETTPTPRRPGSLPRGVLGPVGNREVVVDSPSPSTTKSRGGRLSGKKPQRGLSPSSSSSAAAAKARGRSSSRRATFGGVNARIYFEAENLEPVLPFKPPAPSSTAVTRSPLSSSRTASGVVIASTQQQQQQPVDVDAPSAATTTLPADGGGEERAPGAEAWGVTAAVTAAAPAATQKSRSRSSRRRSIVMPSEAQPFVDSELDDGHVEAAASTAAATTTATAPTTNDSSICGGGGDTRATPKASASASAGGAGKPSQGGSSSSSSSGIINNNSGETSTTAAAAVVVEGLPLSSVNATSCLSRSLAAQRGWGLGDEDTRKQLFRVFYAEAPGSQRARRAAARLFCLTGYVLSPVAPGDARVLCEAAGDSLDWGLDETEPRLVNRPVRLETKELKRGLVLRIKPIFALMENASKEERTKAEQATGVVSRKASPDGYRYEDRETGKRVAPDAYKGPYLTHIRAVRASRVDKYAARTTTAPSSSPSSSISSSCSSSAPAVPEPVNDSIPQARESASSEDVDASSPSALASPAVVAVEIRGSASGGRKVVPAAPTTEPSASDVAGVAVADPPEEEEEEELSIRREDERLPDAVSPEMEVISSRDELSEGAAASAAEEGGVFDTGGNGGEVEYNASAAVVGDVGTPEVFPEVGGAALEVLPMPTVVAGEGEDTGSAVATPTVAENTAVEAVGATAEEECSQERVSLESETPMAVGKATAVGGAEGEGGGAEDANVEEEEALGEAPTVVTAGQEIEAPGSSHAGAVCLDSSPATQDQDSRAAAATTAYSDSVSTRRVEQDKGSRVCATAAVSPIAHVDTPHECGPEASGEVSGRWDGYEAPSPLFSDAPSPVLVVAGGEVAPVAASPELDESLQDGEEGGSDAPAIVRGNRQDGGAMGGVDDGEAATTSPSPRGSAEGGGRSERSDAVATVSSRSDISPLTAAAAAALPLSKTKGSERRQNGGSPLSGGGTPGPEERMQRVCPFGCSTPSSASNKAGRSSPAVSEIAASPEKDGEGAEEIAALREHLFAVWDAAVKEYEDGVALVRSRYNRTRRESTAAASTPVHDGPAVISRPSSAAAGGVAPPQTDTAGKTTAPMAGPFPVPENDTGLESIAATAAAAASPAEAEAETAATTPAVASSAESATEAVAAPGVATAVHDDGGMPTPESPLLPLLQLRLEEEEEDDLFQYSSSWRGAGAGSSQARGENSRRRSLAKSFASHKTRKGPKVQEQARVSSTAAAVQKVADEVGENGSAGGGEAAAAALCRLCCRKACDTVLHPCEHSACGVCVEKLRVQGKQLGQALSCPWDRQPVDDISSM